MGELIPLLFAALMFGAYVHSRAKRALADRRAAPPGAPVEPEPPSLLGALAKRHGLEVRRGVAWGKVRGVNVRVEERGDVFQLLATLERPLVAIRSVTVRAPGDTSPPSFPVSPGFDAALAIELAANRGSKSGRLARAELSPALERALLRAALEGLDPTLTTGKLRLAVATNRRATEHQSALGQLVTIAKAANAVDPREKSPSERRVFAVWSRLGKVEEEPLSLALSRPAGSFLLELAPDATFTHVELSFASPVATDLELISARHVRSDEREPDFELGDQAFDDAFVIRGDQDEIAKELGPSVRDALMLLVRDGAAVELRPDTLRIAVPGALDSESEVESWVSAMERVHVAFSEREERSAYR